MTIHNGNKIIFMRFSKNICIAILLSLLNKQNVQAQITYPNVVQDEVIEISGIITDAQIYPLNYQQKITTRKFFDGLGRLIQSSDVQASPSQKDIISYNSFNNLGQQLFSYLPYVGNDGSGSFHSTAASDQASFYQNGVADKVVDDIKPWSQSVIELSPLERELSSGMNGDGFQTNQHYKSINYRSNNSSVYSNDNDNGGIRLWNYDGTSTGYFPTGSLLVTELTDESNNVTVFYKDINGRLILTRKIISPQIIDGVSENCLDTYNIYDDANNLLYVIPPKAVVAIRQANLSPWNVSLAAASLFTYSMVYDSMGRLTQKKVPGSDWIYIVYDPMNRPVLLQDGNLRSSNNGKWLYFKYDSKGRGEMALG